MNRLIHLITIPLLIFGSGMVFHIDGKEKKGAGAMGNSSTCSSTRFLGTDVDSLVMAICRETATGDMGGIWKATTDGATVGMMPARAWYAVTGVSPDDTPYTMAEEWVMVLLDSPDPTIQPGTIMGNFSPSAKPGYYNATILTKRNKGKLSSPRRFILHLVDDGHLTLRAIHKGIEINPWRFLPYMIRGSIKYKDDTPRDLDGFLKIWPKPRNPHNPRYL